MIIDTTNIIPPITVDIYHNFSLVPESTTTSSGTDIYVFRYHTYSIVENEIIYLTLMFYYLRIK